MTVEQNILCGIREGTRGRKSARWLAEKIRLFRLEGLEKSIPRSSPADSSSASRWPASSAPSRRRFCSTNPSPRSTATSSGTLSWSSPTCSRAFTARSSGSATTWGNAAATAQKVCVMENGVSSSVTDMETLVRHPATQSAAQLTGCRNFLPARRCEGGVRLDGWDILLPLHAAGERATVSVPDGAITVEGGTHTARVHAVSSAVSATPPPSCCARRKRPTRRLCASSCPRESGRQRETRSPFRSSRTGAGCGRNDRRAGIKSCRAPIEKADKSRCIAAALALFHFIALRP